MKKLLIIDCRSKQIIPPQAQLSAGHLTPFLYLKKLREIHDYHIIFLTNSDSHLQVLGYYSHLFANSRQENTIDSWVSIEYSYGHNRTLCSDDFMAYNANPVENSFLRSSYRPSFGGLQFDSHTRYRLTKDIKCHFFCCGILDSDNAMEKAKEMYAAIETVMVCVDQLSVELLKDVLQEQTPPGTPARRTRSLNSSPARPSLRPGVNSQSYHAGLHRLATTSQERQRLLTPQAQTSFGPQGPVPKSTQRLTQATPWIQQAEQPDQEDGCCCCCVM